MHKKGQRRQAVPASGPSCARSGRTAAARVRFGPSASCSRRRSRSAAAHKAGQVTTGPPKLQQQQEGKKNKRGREGGRETNPVVPQLATRRVGRPSGTSGGFEVEVVVDVGHVEARLEVQNKSVNNNNNNDNNKVENLT